MSTLFITIVWISFFGWMIGIGILSSLADGLKIWQWVPIYIFGSIITLIITVFLVLPFSNAYDSYLNTGKISVGFKLPKIIKNFFKKY